jgi:hypothetical protein
MTVTKLVNNAKTLSDKLEYLYLDKFDVQNEYNWLNLTTPYEIIFNRILLFFCMTKNNN